MLKLLLDENLSPTLVKEAHARGYVCSHINHLGLGGYKDWELKAVILEGDWTFITKNNVDFRGKVHSPGSRGVYAGIHLHAGLVCITANRPLDREGQESLFRIILDELDRLGDLTNSVLEVELQSSSTVVFQKYQLPPESD